MVAVEKGAVAPSGLQLRLLIDGSSGTSFRNLLAGFSGGDAVELCLLPAEKSGSATFDRIRHDQPSGVG